MAPSASGNSFSEKKLTLTGISPVRDSISKVVLYERISMRDMA